MIFSLCSNTATCCGRYSVAYSVNKPDWRTCMTTSCTDCIVLPSLDREKLLYKFYWCWLMLIQCLWDNISWLFWRLSKKKKVNMNTGLQLKRRELTWMALDMTLSDGGWPGSWKLSFLNKVIVVSEKWFCGIQETLGWNNILLSVSKKSIP